MKGKWRIIKMPDYTSDYPDMVEPAYIRFDGKGSGEFAFGCVTGHIHGAGDGNAIEFSWDGNDEMDEASGEGWAELCLTARSKVKSASTAAMKPTSPHALGRLLQQPARPFATIRQLSLLHCQNPLPGGRFDPLRCPSTPRGRQ